MVDNDSYGVGMGSRQQFFGKGIVGWVMEFLDQYNFVFYVQIVVRSIIIVSGIFRFGYNFGCDIFGVCGWGVCQVVDVDVFIGNFE